VNLAETVGQFQPHYQSKLLSQKQNNDNKACGRLRDISQYETHTAFLWR